MSPSPVRRTIAKAMQLVYRQMALFLEKNA